MEKINLNEYLASNEYPGRGIAVAMAPDGRQMFIGYFIMGRSENSRNRVFDPVPERGGICTVAADPAKLEDPSLIIYATSNCVPRGCCYSTVAPNTTAVPPTFPAPYRWDP